MFIHAVHDKILESGTNTTIMVDKDIIKTFEKSWRVPPVADNVHEGSLRSRGRRQTEVQLG